MHPLDPLTPDEILKVSAIVRPHFGEAVLNFRVITLQEPPKEQLVEFLDYEHQEQASVDHLPRCARVEVMLPSTKDDSSVNDLFELIVNLNEGRVVHKQQQVGKHSYVDGNYMKQVEKACMADTRVHDEIRSLDLPPAGSVVVEPWTYATDGENDMSQRISMCWFYLRLLDHPDANYYAYPLDLCAEVSEELKVMRVYRLPSTPSGTIHHSSQLFDRRRIHPAECSEYHPALRPEPRNTTKPLHVVQPDGPSFTVDGQLVSWEKWTFRVGFNYREGLTLHNIKYDNRSLFYRLSLAEMFVPYGDPRPPFQRKAAFDLGNDGAGVNANNLQLGCDCLGTIKYFDAWFTTPDGEPLHMPNVVCCHEQDDGILWKHTNFRTQNAVVARSRILVLQTIITVSNYEYIFAFHFGQDASIHYEVRATGILSTVPSDMNLDEPWPYGTIVAPGVMAPYHQHLFSLRIDPSVDGHKNSLQIEESVPFAKADPSVRDLHGIGYTTTKQIVEHESGFDLDHTKNRTFKIINEEKINPMTKTPVGFKLLPSYSQLLLANPNSNHAKRSEFAQHAVWITNYEDDDHFPAGKYTMQSAGGDGIASKIRQRVENGTARSVRNSDIVIWHTFGSTHNPRIEDWPVMPCEKMVVGLKPVNFFSGSPALDVATSKQSVNRSVLYEEERVDTSAVNGCDDSSLKQQ